MEKEELEQLLAGRPPAVRIKAVTLFNKNLETMRAYNVEPTNARYRDWKAAEGGLEAMEKELRSSPEFLPNLPAVLEHLRAAGWKCARASLYRHAKQGMLPVQDGVYRLADVDRYATTWLKQAATGKRAEGASEELQRRKLEKELERLDLDIQSRRLQYDRDVGGLIPRDRVENELAGRAAVLDAGLRHWINANAMTWLRTAEGNPVRVAELIHAMTRSLDEHINHYAAPMEYRVEVVEDPDRTLADDEGEDVP